MRTHHCLPKENLNSRAIAGSSPKLGGKKFCSRVKSSLGGGKASECDSRTSVKRAAFADFMAWVAKFDENPARNIFQNPLRKIWSLSTRGRTSTVEELVCRCSFYNVSASFVLFIGVPAVSQCVSLMFALTVRRTSAGFDGRSILYCSHS